MQTDPLLLDRARRMRREPTVAEARLWRYLRNRQLADAKFVRQHIIGGKVPDFVARAHRLIIEVDGDTHTDQARDDRRSAQLARRGFRVIRFSNADVMSNVEGVRAAIADALAAAPHPTPSPPGRGLSDPRS